MLFTLHILPRMTRRTIHQSQKAISIFKMYNDGLEDGILDEKIGY